jgi:2-keto-3-deoxy-L-rhamnonate aldolase RhmA
MYEAMREFRRKLDEGVRCVGAGITFSDPAATEAIGRTADFFWIDLEHNPIGPEALLGHLIAARAVGAASLVRVAGSETALLKPILDAGAEGIIVPQVRSAAEVRHVVDDCRYPPLGRRGYGPRRPSDYGRDGGDAYIKSADEQVFVAVQIENVDALGELDAIVATPGLDSVVVGPYDLSGSLGKLGRIDDSEVVAAIREIVRVARAAGRYVGFGAGPSEEEATRCFALGAHWVQCGGDFSYMVRFVDRLFAQIRSSTAT